MRMRKGAICSNASLLNWIVKCNGREKKLHSHSDCKNFVVLSTGSDVKNFEQEELRNET